MKLKHSSICIFFTLLLYKNATSQNDCEQRLNTLIDHCDDAISLLLQKKLPQSSLSKELKSFETSKCFDSSARNITKSFRTNMLKVKEPLAKFKHEGIQKNYEDQLANYTDKFLNYRQYLQMVLLEHRQKTFLQNQFRKLDDFLRIDSIYKFKDSIVQKKLKDSIDKILSLLNSGYAQSSSKIINIGSISFYELLKKQRDTIISELTNQLKINTKFHIDSCCSKWNQNLNKHVAGISLFQNHLYGAFYYYRLLTAKNISWQLGSEFVFPISSSTAKNPGIFIMSALQERKLMLQFGIGWLNKTSGDKISWRIGILYFPGRAGLGINYSPLTGIGTSIGIKF